MKKDEEENYAKYLALIGVPFFFVVAPVFGYFFGVFLDKFFQTSPYLSYLFLGFGVVAAIREFYNLFKQFKE